jgi:hypothetical protein
MDVTAACLWGLCGAGAVEALDLYKAIRRARGYPWRQPDEADLGPYLLSVGIRLALGVVAAAVCAASSQIAGPAGAFAAGFAAPKLFEQLARLPHTQPSIEYMTRARDVNQSAPHPESIPDRPVGAGDAATLPQDGGAG